MSKETTIQKIRDANAILSFAKTLHYQLLVLEKGENDEARYWFDSLVLFQTSIYSALVLNLYHLLRHTEKNSIVSLIESSIAHCDLPGDAGGQMIDKLKDSNDQIEELRYNRDKRVAHFDLKNTASLSDETIGSLIELAESVLKEITSIVLISDHSYDISMSRDMGSIMSALKNQIESEKQAVKS